MKNKFNLNIAGTSLTVLTEEKEGYVKELAAKLGADISDILENSYSISLAQAAMLVGMDTLDRYKKADASAANMRTQIRDYLSESAQAKVDAAEQTAKYERLLLEFETFKTESGLSELSSRCQELTDALKNQTRLTESAHSHIAELESAAKSFDYREKELIARLKETEGRVSDANEVIEGLNADIAECERLRDEQKALYDGLKLMNDELVTRATVLSEKNEKLLRQLELLEQMIDEEHADIVENADDAPAPEPEPEEIPLEELEVPSLFENEDEPVLEADIVPLDTHATNDAPSSAQKQVEDLFASLDGTRNTNPPFGPEQSDMPDLGWTKDI